MFEGKMGGHDMQKAVKAMRKKIKEGQSMVCYRESV